MKKKFNRSYVLKLILFFLITSIYTGEGAFCSDSSPSSKTEDEPLAKKRRISKSVSSSKSFVQEDEVELKRGKGSKETGGGPGGFFWKIICREKSAGKVFINLIDTKPIGEHASIQIFLNKSSQGKHIGRIAYAKACSSSSYDEIYAHMRKNNKPSYYAAIAAGFEEVKVVGIEQRLMKWIRK